MPTLIAVSSPYLVLISSKLSPLATSSSNVMLVIASPLPEAGPPQADNARHLAALCEDYLMQAVFYVTDGDEPNLSVPIAPPNEGRLPVKRLYRGEVHTMLVLG